MTPVLYSANVRWQGVDIDTYFSQGWPVTIKDLDALVSRTAELEGTGQDISVVSLRYFWRYEEIIRNKNSYPSVDTKSLTKLKAPTDLPESLCGSSWIQDYLENREFISYQKVPNQKEDLTETVEFEKESVYAEHFVDAINDFHQLCFTCLDENKKHFESSSDRVCYLFDVLNRAELCRKSFLTMEESAARSINIDNIDQQEYFMRYEIRQANTYQRDLYTLGSSISQRLYGFPLLRKYLSFQETIGSTFEKRYGGSIKFNNPVIRYDHYYWKQLECHEELIRAFMNFLDPNSNETTYSDDSFAQFVSTFEANAIQFINSLINHYLEVLPIEFDFSQHCLTFNGRHWPDALFAKLLVELQGNKTYASCVICHRTFPIDAPHNQMYCPECRPRARSYQMRMKKLREKLAATNNEESIDE